jgi:Fumarase
MTDFRKESDSLGVVEVPADKLWGAQTQRSLEHFSIGTDLIPREMITGYAILKKGAAAANRASARLDDTRYKLIVQTCDEILAGKHEEMFPLHVWMTGSGTQFNMAYTLDGALALLVFLVPALSSLIRSASPPARLGSKDNLLIFRKTSRSGVD